MHALSLGGPASFKMLAEVYSYHLKDDAALKNIAETVQLVKYCEEMTNVVGNMRGRCR
ncbi:MAG: hypothetical protein NTX79_07375 [Candidatus Micrarchaeota archaeon]|nr:hypothetical protein [Candidatus Micrarchaeota archaeon]